MVDQTVSPASVTAAPTQRFDIFDFLARFAPLIFLLVLCVIFAVLNERFVSPRNIFNILRQVSITGLLAIGMTFVILTAGIDLSIGSLLAFCGLVSAAIVKGGTQNTLSLDTTQAAGAPLFIAVLAAMGVGLAAGFIQGATITALKVPPFVVTLGGLSAWRGAALLFSGGGPISGFQSDFTYWGQGEITLPEGFNFPLISPDASLWIVDNIEIPILVIIFLLFAILAHIILRYTQYGRHVYAIGGNTEAARLSGLNVNFIIVSVYVIMGFFCGLSGFLLSSRLNSAEAVAGEGYELTVIASVVIGGTSLFGGEGNVPGTVVGALLIGVLLNGLVLLNVNSYIQQIIIGVIIVLAVAFDIFVKSKRRS